MTFNRAGNTTLRRFGLFLRSRECAAGFLAIAACVLVIFFVPTAAFSSGCTADGTGYYIEFTADGQDHTYTRGAKGLSADAFSCFMNMDTKVLCGYATSETVTYTGGALSGSNEIEFRISTETPGTYPLAGHTFGITIDSKTYDPESGTITINTIGQAGSTVEGHFEGTFIYARSETIQVSGTFRLKMLEEDAYTLQQ